jgi:hypothetical protein
VHRTGNTLVVLHVLYMFLKLVCSHVIGFFFLFKKNNKKHNLIQANLIVFIDSFLTNVVELIYDGGVLDPIECRMNYNNLTIMCNDVGTYKD